MKKTLKTGKKALSVFMAALMIMTAWVFFAPEKAEAATAGSYTIKVVVTCTNGFDNKNTTWNLDYRSNNGTGGSTRASGKIGDKAGMFDTGFWGTGGNVVTTLFETSYPGFPTYFEIKGKKSTWTGDGKFRVDVYVNGSWVAGQYTSFSGNVSFTCGATTAGGYYPYVNSVSWNESAANVTVPKTGTATVSTSSATVKDQYGVEWYQEPYYSLHESSVAATSKGDTISGLTLSTYGLADTTTLNVTNSAKDWVAEGGSFNRVIYMNAYLNSKVSSVKKVTVTNCQYTATFDDTANGGKKTTQENCYYKYTSPAAPGASDCKPPKNDDDFHYVFKGWKNTETGEMFETGKTTLTKDTTFVSVYEGVEHNWEETARTNPTCRSTGNLSEKCKDCGMTRSTVLDKVDHDYSVFVRTVAPTCEEQGYDIYRCSFGCGNEEKFNFVSAKGHELEEISRVDPKCEVDGKIVYKCKVCGKQIEEKINRTGHNYVEIVIEKATCEKEGKSQFKCSTCKNYDPDRGGSSGTATVALGHDWGEWETAVAATCTEKGKEERICNRDKSHKESRDIPATGHEFDEDNTIVVAPTCTKQGYSYHPCKHTNCTEQEKFDFVPANGHDEENATWKTTVTPKCETAGWNDLICPVCGEAIRGEEITATGHKWGEYTKSKEATCTENAKETAPCLNGCGKTDTRDIPDTAKGHKFENYVSQNNATCVKDGTKKAQCENYNYNEDGKLVRCTETDIKTDENTALGHNFSINIGVRTAATCLDNRIDIYKCSRCDETEDRVAAGTALGHDIKNWIHDEGTETCCEYGTKHGTCTREGCGVMVENVEDKDTPMLEHVFVDYKSDNNATCLKNGTMTAQCELECKNGNKDGETSRCTVVDTIEEPNSRHGHSFPDPETERDLFHSNNDGTCLSNGTMYAYCKECALAKITVAEPDSKRDHFVANWISDENATCTEDGTKHGTCAYGCGKVFENIPDEGSALGHWFRDYNYKYNNDATCTKDGTRTAKCERCDATKTVTARNTALGHDWSDWTLTGSAATCTEGAELERHCKRNDCTASETKTVGATGHSWTWVIIEETAEDGTPLPADCTRGYRHIKECTVCHVRDEKSEEYVSGGAHHMVRTVVAPTCTEDGLTVVYCDVCNNESVRTETVVPATGHLNSELDKSSVVKATCKDKGYTGDEVCVVCGTVTKKGEEIPVTSEHVFSTYVKLTDATCTENATEKAVCDVCGNAEDTREVPGSALGHYFKNYVSNGNATCTGVETQTAKCERCDATDTIKKYGTALGHDWSDWTTLEEATCTHAGKAEKHCKREGCTVSVTKNLRKLSHAESEWIIDKEASCTESGKRHKECLNGCGYVFDEEVIPMKDHDFVISECTATCIDDGFSTYVCSVCGKEKKGDIVPALGHDWGGEWVLTTKPTCTKKGIETLKCTRCDKTKTREVDALGHNVVVDPAVPATCTEDGLTEGSHCDRCGKVLVKQEKVVKPHYDGDGDGKCDECGKEIKHSTDLNCNCICHKEFWLMRVMYKVLRFFWKLFKIGRSCDCGAVHY